MKRWKEVIKRIIESPRSNEQKIDRLIQVIDVHLHNKKCFILKRLEEEKASCQHYDKDGKWCSEETARKNGVCQAIEIIKEEMEK